MPCWEVQRMDVTFHAESKPLLIAAVKALGWTVDTDFGFEVRTPTGYRFAIDLRAGTANISTSGQAYLNALKREYSRQAIRAAAARQGWRVKETGHNAGTILKQTW